MFIIKLFFCNCNKQRAKRCQNSTQKPSRAFSFSPKTQRDGIPCRRSHVVVVATRVVVAFRRIRGKHRGKGVYVVIIGSLQSLDGRTQTAAIFGHTKIIVEKMSYKRKLLVIELESKELKFNKLLSSKI